MKIICIGLPKTGTTSLHNALKYLGYTSVHFANDPITVDQLRRGDYRLKVLEDHDAISDIPVPAIFPQLDTAFPGAKFIETHRPVESWIKSQQDAPFNSVPPKPGHPRDFYRAMLYGVTCFNEERFRYIHAEHARRIEHYFSERPHDLLTMDLTKGHGWAELCAFLGHPVPDVPFPRKNVKKKGTAA